MDQAQPLIVAPVTGQVAIASPVTVDNPRVFISSLRQSEEGKLTVLTLRSVSDKHETVKLTRPAGADKQVVMLPYGVATVQLEN